MMTPLPRGLVVRGKPERRSEKVRCRLRRRGGRSERISSLPKGCPAVIECHAVDRFSRGVAVLLGLDVGTGGSRAVVVDERGKLVASAAKEHAPFRSPHPGWAEQD